MRSQGIGCRRSQESQRWVIGKDIRGNGWIGVDLDGTLAHYTSWQGIHHIGDPIKPMLYKVRSALERGVHIKIFTARACQAQDSRELAIKHIQDWTEKHIGKRLEVTAEKDFSCLEIWDDRARGVIHNIGEFISGNNMIDKLKRVFGYVLISPATLTLLLYLSMMQEAFYLALGRDSNESED